MEKKLLISSPSGVFSMAELMRRPTRAETSLSISMYSLKHSGCLAKWSRTMSAKLVLFKLALKLNRWPVA